MTGGIASHNPVADEEDRPGRAVDRVRGRAHGVVARRRIARAPHGDRPSIRLTLRDVLGQLDVGRPRPLEAGHAERGPEHLRCRVGQLDPRAPLHDGREHPEDVDVLMRPLVDPLEPGLAGDRDERRAVERGVRDAGEQVRGAGPERGEADPGVRAQPARDVGHERGTLLVPDDDLGDLRAVFECEAEGQRLLARKREHVADALVLEAFHDELGHVHGGERTGAATRRSRSAAAPSPARSRRSGCSRTHGSRSSRARGRSRCASRRRTAAADPTRPSR